MDSARTAVRPVGDALDRRATLDVGRQARVDLAFAVRGCRTEIAHAYAEPPFRVGQMFREGDGLHLILASSAPGIFGGDAFEQSILVGEGAQVRLTSQSALQVHPAARDAGATFASVYRVEAGASLQCEWDPVIPFPRARLAQRIQIDLAKDATLCWSDAFMSGREARGERWVFERLAYELRLVRAGSLDYLERYAINPAEHRVATAWLAEDGCYFGSTLVVHPGATLEGVERLHADLGALPFVRAAADVLGEGLVLVRLMAASGPAFHDARVLATRWNATLKTT